MNTMFKKFATGTAALALMTTVFASTTMAADTTTTITPGDFKTSEITVSPFKDSTSGTAVDISAGLKLTGTTQTLTTAIDVFDIIDASGSGSGWKVNVSATQFSQGGTTPNLLTTGALKLTSSPTITALDDNSDAAANIVKAQPASIDGSDVKLLSAPAGEGQGSYQVAALPLELTLKPSEVYAGTYNSTVTVTLTTGP